MIDFHKATEPFEFDESKWFEHEKPSVLEAFRTLSKEGYYIAISEHDYVMRKKRLEKEYEKNTKAPGPGEEQPKESNPALKEAASQFNDALLDEQGNKIEKLTKENERLKDQIAVLNACKKHNDKIDRSQIKRLGKEISRLNKVISKKSRMIKDKDAVLSDVAEELRLSKIREENLTEVCQKYLKEIEELREELAGKVVDKIDAQALKSAESALAWKDRLIYYKDMALAYNEKKIADLGKELKRQKALADHISKKYDGAKINLKVRTEGLERLEKELEEKTKLIEVVRNASKEYCDYGVAANEFIKELAGLYVLANNSGIIKDEMFERCKNYQTYGFPANCGRETKKEINDIASGKENKKPRISTPEISQEELMKIQEKVVASCDIAEEGGDHSGVIVLCGKDVFKKFKENEESVFDFFKRHKETAEELHEVADEALEQLLLFGEIIIKTEK